MKLLNYEPKRSDRFLVEFPKILNLESFVVQKINKPKFSNGEWMDMKIEFVDPIVASPTQSLYYIVEHIHGSWSFDISIKSLDPTGVVIEEWVVCVEKILLIDFGDLDYSNLDFQHPTMVIKPSKCALK